MKAIKYIFIFLFLTQLDVVHGAHIVGGDASYTFVRFNADTTKVTFRFQFNMYRDEFSGGAPFDTPADFGIYNQRLNGSWQFVDQRSANPGPVNRIPSIDNPCIVEPTDVGTEATAYIFEYTFDIVNTNYQIAYQRCCRNNSISNIFNPGDTGAAFLITITPLAQRLGNSSPRFNDFPPLFLCANDNFEFDDSASDPDGDVIRYSFCAPTQAGGTFDANLPNQLRCCDCVRPDPVTCPPSFAEVTFRPPFTSVTPLGGNPVVQINTVTGLIFGTPTIVGQYVVGVCAEEYRNNVLIGSIRRDFQFNIIGCQSNVIAQFDYEIIGPSNPNDECQNFRINSCGENTIRIVNDSQLPASIFEYHWTFFNPDGTILDEIVGGSNVRDVDITFPDLGQYQGKMVLNEGTQCADSACFSISIFPDIMADFNFDYDTCVAGTVQFSDLSVTGAPSITDWTWDFGDGQRSNIQDANYLFQEPGNKLVRLLVEDSNACTAEVLKSVPYFPVPQLIVVEPTTFVGCLPANIFFNNLSVPIDTSYDIQWQFGDGETSDEISPTHMYTETGVYSVSIDITSPLGCSVSKNFDSWIRILDSPDADYSFSPDEPNNFTDAVSFMDLSSSGVGWQWEFGSVGSSLLQNPNFSFPDTGLYDVKLTVFHPITNCPDTITKTIDIRPLTTLFMPNAFTPNNDGRNDEFKGKGYTQAIGNYELLIFNRWGEMIFESVDPLIGWNGQFNNTGELSPLGVYIYKVTYTDPRGERKILEGHVTLVR